MRIVAISDLHGYLPTDLPEGDTLCICGDIFPLSKQSKVISCYHWLDEQFIPWTEQLPYNDVIIIAGNHDFFFEKASFGDIIAEFTGTKITYLKDSWVKIKGIKFYGTPWCHRFGNWAFMDDDYKLEMIFENIPEDVDFLLTHDAPYGCSDQCLQVTVFTNPEKHIGSKPLRDAIITKKPKYVLHGHLHSTNYEKELLEESKVYNVSLLNEDYQPAYEPLVIDYEKVL